jgi:alpha-galactosidase
MRLASLALAVSFAAAPAFAQSPATFAASPYMGWSSWSLIRAHPTEQNIKAQADALIANHLPELGYRYVNVDDGWSDGFDDHGIPKANATSFPSGMDGMAKYMHAHGLRFGLYLNPGISDKLYKQNPVIAGTTAHIADITDATQQGSTRRGAKRIDFSKSAARTYIQSQVDMFNAWGIDFIKFDFVGPGGGNLPADNREDLRQWHAAIVTGGRPIWLELSNYLSIDQAPLWRATSNGWRIENDIECYGCDKTSGFLTQWSKVSVRFADVVPWLRFAGAGPDGAGWNDLDTLELGNGDKDGLTPAERRAMFAFWSITCAPLYLGSDLTQMDPADLALISNKDLIAVDQAGLPARPLDIQHLRNHPQQVWLTTYPDGSAVIAFFNLDKDPATIKVNWREIDALRDTHFAGATPASLHDVFTGTSIPAQPDGISVSLDSHATQVYRIPARP